MSSLSEATRADLRAGGELQLVLGHARAGDGVDDARLDTEVAERLGKLGRDRLDDGARLAFARRRALQERGIGQTPLTLGGLERHDTGLVARLFRLVGQRKLLARIVVERGRCGQRIRRFAGVSARSSGARGKRVRACDAGTARWRVDVGEVAGAVDECDRPLVVAVAA